MKIKLGWEIPLAACCLMLGSLLSAADGWYTEGDFVPISRVKLVLENPLDSVRRDCPVIVSREAMPVKDLNETWITVVDPNLPAQPVPTDEQLQKFGGHLAREETNGHFLQYQLDDIDKDGIWDELFFMTDFQPREKKVIYLYIGETSRGMYEHETHAEIGSYGRHIVPIWESKAVGWKLWFPTDVDLLLKPRPVLVGNMEDVLNLSGYNVPPEFGTDGMTVSNTFGAGGIGLFEDPAKPDFVSRPRFSPFRDKGPMANTRYSFDVVSNGPLRSMVSTRTMNWRSGKGTYELVQYYTAYKNKSYSTCRVRFTRFRPSEPRTEFGCGIRAIMNEDNVFQKGGVVISFGKNVELLNPTRFEPWRNRVQVDFEGIALVVKDRYRPRYQYVPVPTGAAAKEMMKLLGTRPEDIIGANHAFRVPVTRDLTFEYMLAAGWSNGYVNRTPEEFREYVLDSAAGYNHPVEIRELTVEHNRR
jgi:hypothetical protein